MATRYNLNLDAGSDWSMELAYQDSDGTPIDLTDFDCELVVRRSIPGAPADITLSPGSGITITPNQGKLLIQFTHTQTAGLEGRFVYDLHLISPADIHTRILDGHINVNPLL